VGEYYPKKDKFFMSVRGFLSGLGKIGVISLQE
jgi:hypothetical protein